jgi:catechol 2,3-dioxygenase-like lactoylglutathione lyase family enzyme
MNEAMSLQLNHYSIRTADLEACRRFYEGVLGLAVGPRPAFPFPGLWLYAGDPSVYSNAVVHIIGYDRDDPKGLTDYLGGRDPASLQGTGVVDHVAFAATGLAAMRERLAGLGIAARERTVPSLGLQQVFIEDPNGVTIELNYPAAEAAAAAR